MGTKGIEFRGRPSKEAAYVAGWLVGLRHLAQSSLHHQGATKTWDFGSRKSREAVQLRKQCEQRLGGVVLKEQERAWAGCTVDDMEEGSKSGHKIMLANVSTWTQQTLVELLPLCGMQRDSVVNMLGRVPPRGAGQTSCLTPAPHPPTLNC